MPADRTFFEESKQQSVVKTAIVSKYFWAWAKVIMPAAKKSGGRIAYIDVFAGPGRYGDGTKSTPLLILERAIADADMREMLVTLFNDGDPANATSLSREIAALADIRKLRYEPKVTANIVNDDLAQRFEERKLVPTLLFIDPWGYKGLSLRLIEAVLKHWGCDCIFFFNYNRISMGLPNEAISPHLDALFGTARADDLRRRLGNLSGEDREFAIVEELSRALQDKGGRYVLPFRFKNEVGSRTSHHLIFVSKNVKGYSIMKDIMANESSTADQGVPSFEYSPADERFPMLFELSRPLDQLEDLLLEEFAGQTLAMKEVYERHHVGRRYIEKNYKAALRRLEEKGTIAAIPPAAERPKRQGETTFAGRVRVTFPKRGS